LRRAAQITGTPGNRSNAGWALAGASASICDCTMKKLKTALALALLFSATACGGGKRADSGDAGMFVAVDGDFAGFQSWFGGVLPSDVLDGNVYPPGTRFGFVNHRVPPGTKAYPPGTVIVKAIESPAGDPTQWHVFAFAKRGGDFNAAGAIGWEFFLLRLDAGGTPTITSRGLAPANDGFDMDTLSYTPGGAAGSCNICHGQKAYAATDHLISALLAPGSTLTPTLPVSDGGSGD
jgi:hypothetical protein